jgi:hypothetical protein
LTHAKNSGKGINVGGRGLDYCRVGAMSDHLKLSISVKEMQQIQSCNRPRYAFLQVTET